MRTVAVLFVSLALLSAGCWGAQVKTVLDAAAESQVKVMEAQAKIDKERRAEKYTVEGVVRRVEMREKEVLNPDQGTTKKVKYCLVLFADGREKEFGSVPPAPLDAGTYYKIEYNGLGEVTGVEKK